MKKLMAILAMAMLLLAACGESGEKPAVDKAEKPKEETKQEPEKKEEPKEEKPKEEKKAKPKKDEGLIKVTDELTFANYTVTMKSVRVYEKKDKAYADIKFNWLNQAGDGKKMFMQLSALDVEQGGVILEETTEAWDPANKNSSPIYFPNAQSGEVGVELTYALENKEDPITITFVPITGEGSEKVTVDIN